MIFETPQTVKCEEPLARVFTWGYLAFVLSMFHTAYLIINLIIVHILYVQPVHQHPVMVKQ